MQIKVLRVCATVFLLLAFLAAGDLSRVTSHAQRDKGSRLSELTTKIASADPAEKFFGGEYENAARERFEILKSIVESDPGEALRSALPAHILKNVPAGMQDLFEKRDGIEGELEVLAECEEHTGTTHYFLVQGENRYQMYFRTEPNTELLTGARVKIDGVQVGNKIAVEDDGMIADERFAWENDTLQSASLVSGEIKVLVMLVNFQNDTRTPYTQAQANDLIFNTANSRSVTNYYNEASYGKAWVAGDTVGWFTLPMNGGTNACNKLSTVASLGKQAAADSGVTLSQYNKFMYVFPNSGCDWGGWAEIGGSQSWIDGSLVLRTTAHELGHNLGLYHSKAMRCSDIISGSCTTTEYGHNSDMVGQTGVTGHYHPYQKERLGWLNNGAVVNVQGAGVYTIGGVSVQDSNPKALRILKANSTYYYVEFRRPVGFDSFVANNSNTMNGVLITQNSSGSSNFLLDMVPSTTSWSDAALKVGQSFTDPNTNMTITVLSVSSGGAVVDISYGTVPCTAAAPTVWANPSEMQWMLAGHSIDYTVTATNNNTSNCTSNLFTVSAGVPPGWSSTSAQVSVAPGSSGSAVVRVTAPSSAAAGAYSALLRAENAGNVSGLTREMSVFTAFEIAVSSDKPVYSTGSVVTLSASVSANGSPAAGSSVTFTITKPTGGRKSSIVTGTAVTGADGGAMYIYRLNKKQDPAGIYQVSATSNFSGVSGRGFTSFEVR